VGTIPATDLSGQIDLDQGGTGANLSASGGPGQYLKQSTPGGAVSVGTIPATDLSGLVDVDQGGTGANLSGSGGPGQFLKQTTPGGPVSVGSISASDLPNRLIRRIVRICAARQKLFDPTGWRDGDIAVFIHGKFVRLPLGENGQVLVVDRHSRTGLNWVNPRDCFPK
jgi:hypothetical protein